MKDKLKCPTCDGPSRLMYSFGYGMKIGIPTGRQCDACYCNPAIRIDKKDKT